MGNHSIVDIPIFAQQNLEELCKRVNVIRLCYGKPMIVTSGFRTHAEQMKINPSAPMSNHLTGHAVDIADVGGSLRVWCKNNVEVLEVCNLWCEEPNFTAGWIHFQDIPPRSGKRFFLP